MRRLGIILFFLIIICIPVYAQVAASPIYEQKGGYTIKPYEPSQNQTVQNLTYTNGAMNTISFWDLPIWIQIAFAIEALIGLVVIIKVLPIVLGRLSSILENKRAMNVLTYITSYPGSTITKISRGTNVNRNMVKYYINYFVKNGDLILERVGRYSLLYKTPVKYDIFERKVISYLHEDMDWQILFTIIENPGITNAELSKKFELKKSTVHWYVDRFIKDKIITCDMQGRFKKYHITVNAEEIIRKYAQNQSASQQ